MPVPHLNIRIVQRSKGSSAVAGAAYQAGEKLFSEYDQKVQSTTAGNSPVVVHNGDPASGKRPAGVCRPQHPLERRRSS